MREKIRIDLYSFGFDMPGRNVGTEYRYGNNSQERERTTFEGAYSADFWGYDSRLGRRWEKDPISYPWQSPYVCFNNNPIYYSDPSGLEGEGGPKKGDVYDCGDGTHEVFNGNEYLPAKGTVYKGGLIKNKAGVYIPPPPLLNKHALSSSKIDVNRILFVYKDNSKSFEEAQLRYRYDVYSDNKKIGSVIIQSSLSQPVLVKWFYDSKFRASVDKKGYGPSIELDESFGPATDAITGIVNASSYRAQMSLNEVLAASIMEGAAHLPAAISRASSYFKNVAKVNAKTESSKANTTTNAPIEEEQIKSKTIDDHPPVILQPSVQASLGTDYHSITEITVPVKSGAVLQSLNEVQKGSWVKVYEAGVEKGQRMEVHYFRNNQTGSVFDVKVKYMKWQQKSFNKK